MSGERLWSSCCGRRYSRSTSAEILRKLRAEYAAIPVDQRGSEGPWWLNGLHTIKPTVIGELRANGYVTLGDLAAAGDDLLDVHGIGPATLARIEAHLEEAWAALLHVNGVATVPTSALVPE
jgi:hypothetical protein